MDDIKDDDVRHNAAGVALPRAHWALVRDGVVAAIVRTYDHVRHPFGEIAQGPIDVQQGHVALEGEHVIRVDGTDAAIGNLVDAKGNVTPSEGRTRALVPGEAAYRGPEGDQVAPVAPDEGAEVAATEPATPALTDDSKAD